MVVGLKRRLIGFTGLLIATALSTTTPLVKKQASQESIRFLGSLLFIGIVILNWVRTLVCVSAERVASTARVSRPQSRLLWIG